MDATNFVSAHPLIGDRRMSRFQILTLLLCGLCAVVDGFDVQVIGYVAPAIVREWGIDKATLGPVFSAGLLGLVIGSILLSVVADRVGRRPTLIATMLSLFVCCVMTASVRSLTELLVLRFITGIALGSVLPNAMALAGEFSPARHRVTSMMLVSVGFTAGAVLGGFMSALILPAMGWRGVFLAGGVAPLAIAVAMYLLLPESLHFLLRRGKYQTAQKWLRRIDNTFHFELYNVDEGTPQQTHTSSLSRLFAEDRAKLTLQLWAANIFNLVTLFFLSNWLPTLMISMNTTEVGAVWAGTLLQLGGTVGAVLMGPTIDRRGFRSVLGPCFVVAACGLLTLGFFKMPVTATLIVTFIIGFCVVGGQSGLNALAAASYPPDVRATGIGAAVGVGRLVSVGAPLLASAAIAAGFSANTIFLCSALPAIACAAIMTMLGTRRSTFDVV
ncbi:MFS transporter [Paraburkholderia caribensis]|uniref:MFS transporter n=1 Tax=Paraburkholderia caribensis TaxID=75105 RepID=UPI001CAADBA7|nr:MFS transporter [Paraburkholderia caribensis]CAG9243884.1 4-hydroxybenzoate transporter [Paraburkholderia caribensis]